MFVLDLKQNHTIAFDACRFLAPPEVMTRCIFVCPQPFVLTFNSARKGAYVIRADRLPLLR